MKDTLDSVAKKVNQRNSKISFRCFLVALCSGVLALFINKFFEKLIPVSVFEVLLKGFMLAMFLSTVIGFIFGIKSFIDKEKNDYKKIIGFFGSLILIILLIAIFCFFVALAKGIDNMF